MSSTLLSIITALLVYQGSYYLYLLYIAKVWTCPYLNYALFRWHFLRGYSMEARILLLLALSSTNYSKMKQLFQGLYQKTWKAFGSSCAGILLVLSFIWVEQLFSLNLTLWAYPSLLGLILLTLPLPIQWSSNTSSQTLTKPSHYVNTPWSISLPTQQGSLPINNPQRGIYVLGNQGSGKTRFVLEPMLYALIQKGYAGLIYDYDFEAIPASPNRSYCLTKFAYNCFVRFKPKGMQFRSINFTDPSSSARINPFSPSYL